jgi:dihydrofolate reductase
MLHFKSITTGNVIVMGRKTFESIGKPLANRINIVLTRDLKFKVNGVVIYHDINKLIEDFINKDIYVIGGKQIYEAFKKYADMYIISYINSVYDCDTFMDNMNINNFKLLKEDNSHNDFKVK